MNVTDENCADTASQSYFIVVTFFACLFNVTLFYLIRTATHNLMKVYLKILYSSVIIDFTSALFQFSTQVRPSTQAGILTMSMDGFLPAMIQDWELFRGGRLNYILILEYFACYSVIVYSIVPFVFRYLIACWNYHMGPIAFSLLMIFVLGTALYASISINYLCALVYDNNINFVPIPNPNCTRYLPQVSNLNMKDSHIAFVFETWLWIALFFQYNYVIILFCAFNVYVRIIRSSTFSTQEKLIQLQLFFTISAQALIPFLVYYFQFVLTRVVYRFEFSKNISQDLLYKSMFTSYSIVPLTNPLAAIFMISSYRRTLKQLIFRAIGDIYVQRSDVHPTNSSPH
ncbi:hypothetical protein M3Y97_00618400 [Aphelenchoides bicaudatus]|nr:hypothetical protein M3Y97_00618400 [Aphelenchoides bicaudatus]